MKIPTPISEHNRETTSVSEKLVRKEDRSVIFLITNILTMRLYNLARLLCVLYLVIGPVYSDEDQSGRTRRLVRRKKQPLQWDLEETRNIVYNQRTAETEPEGRAIRPVKIKRRKIVNGKPQRIVKKPTQTIYPKIIPSLNNVTQPVAPKPDEAKRCNYFLNPIKRRCMLYLFQSCPSSQ